MPVPSVARSVLQNRGAERDPVVNSFLLKTMAVIAEKMTAICCKVIFEEETANVGFSKLAGIRC